MNVQPMEYRFTELPNDHPEVFWFSVSVRWNDALNGWQVTRNGGDMILDRDGVWGEYPPVTERTEAWRHQHCRPSLSEAMDAARLALPKIRWQGRSAVDLLVARSG